MTEDWKGLARFVSEGECFEPAARSRALYEAGYQRYQATYEALMAIR
jgi:hypothetical protein